MALASLIVRDVQSLKHVKIPVGRLTVVVGESNVGKSALVRAVTLLARNGPSTGLVRQGADTLAVAAMFDETVVTIKRGAKVSEYQLVPRFDSAPPRKYAKCGIQVPPDVAAFLSLASNDMGELSFALQHDPPFMLSQPASAVARQIAAITNAQMLNDAVRETNRRRLEATQQARSFVREAEECREQLRSFGDLRARRESLGRVTTAVTAAAAQEMVCSTMRGVMRAVWLSLAELSELEKVKAPGESVVVLESARAKAQAIQKVRSALIKAGELRSGIRHEADAAREWEHGAKQLEEDAHRILVEAGVCPVCQQKVSA